MKPVQREAIGILWVIAAMVAFTCDWWLVGALMIGMSIWCFGKAGCYTMAGKPWGSLEFDAAAAVSRIYFEIAADAIGEESVRRQFNERFDKQINAMKREEGL